MGDKDAHKSPPRDAHEFPPRDAHKGRHYISRASLPTPIARRGGKGRLVM